MNIEDILNFDPVAEAEKRGMDDMQMLGLAAVTSEVKREVMEAAGDTHHSMKMQQFLTCVIMHGFKIVYQEELVYRCQWDKTEQHDTFYILWDGSKLIVCESYRGSLNGGNCYFSWRGKTDRDRPFGPCSNGWKDTAYGCSIDVREGLFYWLEKNKQAGEFVLPHVDCMGPWLTAFTDHMLPDGSRESRPYHVYMPELEAKSKARATKLPKEVFDNLVGRFIK